MKRFTSERAEEAGAIDNQVTESNRQGGTGEARLRVWLHDAGLGGLMPECIGEAELSRLEVKVLVGKASDAEIAQYKQAKEAIDAQSKRSPEHQTAVTQWILDNPFKDSPEEKLERGGTVAYFERCDREVAESLDTKQCQNCRHVQMHPDGDRGRCARVWAAMPDVASADTCEHWRSQFVDLLTEDGHVEHLGAGQPIDSVGALMPEGLAGYAPSAQLPPLPLIKALYPPLPDLGSKDDDEPDDLKVGDKLTVSSGGDQAELIEVRGSELRVRHPDGTVSAYDGAEFDGRCLAVVKDGADDA